MNQPNWLQLAHAARQQRASTPPRRGDMLVFESHLAEQLGVKRTTLRSYSNALDALEYLTEALGTEVTDLARFPPTALRTLARWHQRAPHEVISFLASGPASARAVLAAEQETRGSDLERDPADDIIALQRDAAPASFDWQLRADISLHLSAGARPNLALPLDALDFERPADRWARYCGIDRSGWLMADRQTQNDWREAAWAAHVGPKSLIAVLQPIGLELAELYNNRAREIWSRALSAAQSHQIVIVPVGSPQGLDRLCASIPPLPVEDQSPPGFGGPQTPDHGATKEAVIDRTRLRPLQAGGLIAFAHATSLLRDLYGVSPKG